MKFFVSAMVTSALTFSQANAVSADMVQPIYTPVVALPIAEPIVSTSSITRIPQIAATLSASPADRAAQPQTIPFFRLNTAMQGPAGHANIDPSVSVYMNTSNIDDITSFSDKKQ